MSKEAIRTFTRRLPGYLTTCSAFAWSAPAAMFMRSGTRVLDHERLQAFRIRAGLSVDRRRAGPREARGKQHRTTVQFARRNRTQRRWANQPYGECRGHRDNKSRAGHDRRGQVEIHSRRPVPLCRAKAAIERGGLCLRLADELSQPEHRAPVAELWPDLF